MNKYLSLAQRSQVGKERYEWRLAYVAYRFTNHAELAEMLMVDRSTPHRWASAYEMFLYISQCCTMQHARHLRRSLTRSHFSRLNVLRRKYEFSPREAMEYLEDALYARMGSGRMSIEVEAIELGGGGMWGDWKKYTLGLRGLLDKLRVPFGFPDEFTERATRLSGEVIEFAHDIDEERKRL